MNNILVYTMKEIHNCDTKFRYVSVLVDTVWYRDRNYYVGLYRNLKSYYPPYACVRIYK